MLNIVHLSCFKQMLEKLKFIDLSYSEDFSRTPNFLMLPNLEELVLEGCIKLVEVHPSLGQLKKLVVLNLKDCKNLKALPLRMEMDSLNKLIISGCSKVKKLPEFGENMTNLFILDLKNCKNLICLPRSTCNLKSLKILNILGCSKFSTLPQNLNENKFLEELDLSGTAIKDVPSSIIGLLNLKSLYLKGCKGLSLRSNTLVRSLFFPIQKIFGYDNEAPPRLVFPSFISSIVSLKELYLDNCNLKVGSIPNDLGRLSSLELLSLSRNDLSNEPAYNWVLSSLFSCLSSLKTLHMCNCNLNDGSIPKDLSFSPSLTTLGLLGNNFTRLPAGCISNLLHLHTLHLSHCPRLKFLPDLPPNLQRIDTVACHSLQPLSFPEMLLKCIAFANASMAYFPQSRVYNLELAIWWILGNEIPSWFHNQDFQILDKIVGFQDNHVVRIFEQTCHDDENGNFIDADSIVSIEVDITHFHDSSKSWGISLCVVLQDIDLDDVYHLDLLMTCKASGDEFFKKEIGWGVKFEGHSNQMLTMYLPLSNFTVSSSKVEFIFYTKKILRANMEKELDVKVDGGGHGKFLISKCGWRVTCKEDVQEWLKTIQQCSTSDINEIFSQNSGHGKRYREGKDLREEIIINDEEIETYLAQRRKLNWFSG
ncbi:disease resistance protein RPV1-like isoform X1 [Prosopis cineraria]|uniref:disease resistance protein RPV1-like isoform X1 n=1 Tax=Prosopis cineraria TaxID=364024 RepID=UPI00240F901F|nr:disease resistance protein RPV1-like isoform X1 [Prosopis cineraria]